MESSVPILSHAFNSAAAPAPFAPGRERLPNAGSVIANTRPPPASAVRRQKSRLAGSLKPADPAP